MTLPPIPSHLPTWQAPHLAWLASQGHSTLYAVPEGTEAVRAVLSGADLRGANLRRAVLSGAYLRGAYLHGADLSDAYLSEANLHGANLHGAYLRGADLSWANLRGANLRGATGIATIGPVGRQRRLVYAVAHDDGPMVQAGCWWGSVPDTIARIEDEYADDPAARDRYVAAVRAVAALVSP